MIHCYTYPLVEQKAEAILALSCLTKCISEIELWMKANLLKLNTEKTEILILGTKSVIRKYHLDDFRVGVSSTSPRKMLGIWAVFFILF